MRLGDIYRLIYEIDFEHLGLHVVHELVIKLDFEGFLDVEGGIGALQDGTHVLESEEGEVVEGLHFF